MRIASLVLCSCVLLAGCPSGGGDGGDGGDDGGPVFAEARSQVAHDEDPQLDDAEVATLAADNHALTVELYHALRDGQLAGQGFSLSAFSIQSAFGMLYAGTVEPARTEMATTLHLSLPGDREHVAHNWLDAQLLDRNLPADDDPEFPLAAVELRPANGVWVLEELREAIAPAFLDVLATHYDAGLFLAQFDTQPEIERAAINDWVAARTQDLIPELFGQGVIRPDTRMVLVNALYLRAPWAEPFFEEATAPAPFERLDGTTVEVPMMHASALGVGYTEGEGYQAVALPMRGRDLQLVVILPDDFAAFEAGLAAVGLDAILSDLAPSLVDTSLPRFELEAQMELSLELQELGMIAPFFDDGSFDGILPGLGVITAVVHQTVIKVDEKGTEAAAATGIVVGEVGAPEPDATIVVDRPFLVAIHDVPTDTLLFFGRVLQP
jgi:serpin B